MTTSGSYLFNPSMGSQVVYAFQQCGIRPTALLQEHMESARVAAGLVLMDFSNRGVNLWKVELVTQALTQGVTTYSVDPSIVLILDAYISIQNGTTYTDRIILPVSRSEYASYPNKTQQGGVTTFWHDRTLTPTVSLYLTPNGQQPFLKYYAMQQIQDANYTAGQTLDLPAVWLPAFIDALSVRLAMIWAPDRLSMLAAQAVVSYDAASDTNTETSEMYITPGISGYFL